MEILIKKVDGIMEGIQRLYEREDTRDRANTLGRQLGFNDYTFDGRKDADDKASIIQYAKDDVATGRRCIFFTTIKTSAVGINLQFMHVGIFPSPDWNPANEEQAIRRMYRIGQKEKVKVFRFVHRCLREKVKGVDDHIDDSMELKKIIKSNKADAFINGRFNAARDWPVRDLDDEEGEKSVLWREPTVDDNLRKKSEKYGLDTEDIRDPKGKSRINGGLITKTKKKDHVAEANKKMLSRSTSTGNKLNVKPKSITMDEMREMRLNRFDNQSEKIDHLTEVLEQSKIDYQDEEMMRVIRESEEMERLRIEEYNRRPSPRRLREKRIATLSRGDRL